PAPPPPPPFPTRRSSDLVVVPDRRPGLTEPADGPLPVLRGRRDRQVPLAQAGGHPEHGRGGEDHAVVHALEELTRGEREPDAQRDRKSTRLNSSHVSISY